MRHHLTRVPTSGLIAIMGIILALPSGSRGENANTCALPDWIKPTPCKYITEISYALGYSCIPVGQPYVKAGRIIQAYSLGLLTCFIGGFSATPKCPNEPIVIPACDVNGNKVELPNTCDDYAEIPYTPPRPQAGECVVEIEKPIQQQLEGCCYFAAHSICSTESPEVFTDGRNQYCGFNKKPAPPKGGSSGPTIIN